MSVGPIRRFRRAVLTRTLAAAASASGRLPDEHLGAAVRGAVRIARVGLAPSLRRNLREAFGTERPLRPIERDYFNCAADWARYTALTFHRGFARSGFADNAELDESFAHLQDASEAGRGVVLVGPHQFCHELFAALIHARARRPLVGLIRAEERNATLVARWYRQFGMPTIVRSAHAGAVADFRALLRILGEESILGVTPDLPGAEGEGEEVVWFDRRVRLRAGAFWLALRSGAAVVRYRIERAGPRWICSFSPPTAVSRESGVPPTSTVRRHLELWARELEQELQINPAGWAFWLDRRWSRVLRQPRSPGP